MNIIIQVEDHDDKEGVQVTIGSESPLPEKPEDMTLALCFALYVREHMPQLLTAAHEWGTEPGQPEEESSIIIPAGALH